MPAQNVRDDVRFLLVQVYHKLLYRVHPRKRTVHHPSDVYLTLLPRPIRSANRLQLRRWVPRRTRDVHAGRLLQVQPDATRPNLDKKHRVRWGLPELFDAGLALLLVCDVSVDAKCWDTAFGQHLLDAVRLNRKLCKHQRLFLWVGLDRLHQHLVFLGPSSVQIGVCVLLDRESICEKLWPRHHLPKSQDTLQHDDRIVRAVQKSLTVLERPSVQLLLLGVHVELDGVHCRLGFLRTTKHVLLADCIVIPEDIPARQTDKRTQRYKVLHRVEHRCARHDPLDACIQSRQTLVQLGFRVANFVPFIQDHAVPLAIVQQALGVHHRVGCQDNTLKLRQVADALQTVRSVKHTDGHQTVCEALDLVAPLTHDRLGNHDERLGEWVAAHHGNQLSRLADTHFVAQETTTDTVVILAFQEPLDTSRLERGKERQRHFEYLSMVTRSSPRDRTRFFPCVTVVMTDPPGNKRPFSTIQGRRITQMFGGAGSGILTKAAQRVAKARENYRGTTTRERLSRMVAARNELKRIGSASLKNLKSNFKSPEELEKKINELEKQQYTKKPNNKARLVGARKRVSNMRTPLKTGGGFRRAGLLALAAAQPNGLSSHPLKPVKREKTPAVNVNIGSFFESAEAEKAAKNVTAGAIASIIKNNKNIENRRARERKEFNKKKYKELIESGENISNADRKRIELLYNNLAKNLEKRNAANKAAANKAANNAAEEKAAANKKEAANKAAAEKKAAANKEAANKAAAKKAANKAVANAKAAENAEKKARNALKNYLVATVKPRYNKALVNAILKLPELNNNTRRRLQSPKMYALQRGAGVLGRGAMTAGGAFRNRTTPAAPPATSGGFFSRLFTPKPPSFIPRKNGIPLGYVLKTNNKGKTGYYKNNKALESQIEHRGEGPAPKPVSGTNTGVSVGVGPNRKGNNRGEGPAGNTGVSVGVGPNRYGYNRGGGIIFRPQITVGAARIGAQTFGGTRVGGQTMGSSRATTGNVSGSRVTTGNTGNSRLAVSAPTPNGNRRVAATSEQLIRGAGGAEVVEQGIKALNAANGNVARAKAASKLPNKTFTNIYAMGGPVAAKRLVEKRRRRRAVASKKKRVVRKPKKQYIKLTPYQFKRLTDHIKKNNLRKVLIKEITH